MVSAVAVFPAPGGTFHFASDASRVQLRKPQALTCFRGPSSGRPSRRATGRAAENHSLTARDDLRVKFLERPLGCDLQLFGFRKFKLP